MDAIGDTAAGRRTMPHRHMVAAWRAGTAEPVSPRIIEYVHHDGDWWRRTGAAWESIPDGPFAMSLHEGHARLARAHRDAGLPPCPRVRDPWTVARNRRRTGATCGRPPAFLPMRGTDLRPVPPVICRQRPPSE